VYPVPLPAEDQLGKNLLETSVVPDRSTDVDGLAAVLTGGGAADALARP
jgi:hypothetical protein